MDRMACIHEKGFCILIGWLVPDGLVGESGVLLMYLFSWLRLRTVN